MPTNCGRRPLGSYAGCKRPMGDAANSNNPANGAPVFWRETLLRFAPPKYWDSNGKPTAAALSLKRQEDGLSVYLNDLLASRNLGPQDVIANRPGYGVFGMAASHVIDAHCTLVHDPLPNDQPVRIGFAHALLRPPDDKIAWKLLRGSLLASATVIVAPVRRGEHPSSPG
jgi:hypothetical protein